METTNLAGGNYLITTGDTIRNIYILVRGKILMETKNDDFLLESGSIIGLPDATGTTYANSYMAVEDCTVVSYPFHAARDYGPIFEEVHSYQYAFVHGAIIQCGQIMERYELIEGQVREYMDKGAWLERAYYEICEQHDIPAVKNQFSGMVKGVSFSDEVEEWEREYNKAFARKDVALIKEMYADDLPLCLGEIQNASIVMRRAVRYMEEGIEYMQSGRRVILSSEGKDYFQLLFDARKKMAERGTDQSDIAEVMNRLIEFCREAKLSRSLLFDQELLAERVHEYEYFDFEALFTGGFGFSSEMGDTDIGLYDDAPGLYDADPEEDEDDDDDDTADCLATILEYAGKTEEEIAQIRAQIDAYRDIPDVFATDDETRKMRRDLTNMFFEVYEKAFFKSLDEEAEELDEILQMFFQFGFMDVQLIGEDNANNLYELTDRIYACNTGHVYTIYRWLRAIAMGEKEPSKNEFDLDYTQDLREQVKMGQITKAQAKEKDHDIEAKVRFEIHNMFKSTNRATYGRFSTYCPIMREEDFIKAPEDLFVTVDKLGEAMNSIRKVDFSCFYRDTMITDDDLDLPRMEIKVEVMPDIILLPNSGTRAMMWQETGDVRRDSPARFMFPIFTISDIDDMMVEVCGRYRWEICRKVQGARWNDIRERSLTSEYCDYLQFYRKNHDLTGEAKEKVKNALQKCKNNYREVFVKDYVTWIKFEAKGSIRMNKVSRDIVFRYCPFGKGRRRFLAESPMYREMIEKYDIINKRNKDHITSIFSRYEKNGGELLPEMKTYLEFFDL